MAIIASSSSKVIARKALRRQRRTRRSLQRATLETPSVRKQGASKRQKLRHRDSENFEGCYYPCEDQGDHFDFDVHVGREADLTVNRYSLPEADITDPTTSPNEPFPELPRSDSGVKACVDFPLRGPTKRKITTSGEDEYPVQHGINIDPSSALPLLFSPTSRSSPIARAKFPDCDFPSPKTKSPPVSHAGDLFSIEIPSPLLYHTFSEEYVAPDNPVQPYWDTPCFEFTCGQSQPEPDFASYRARGTALTTKPPTIDRRDSLGLALCTVASSRHKLEESQVSDESHDSSTHGCPLPTEPNCVGSSCPTGDIGLRSSIMDMINSDQADLNIDPEWSWADDILQRRRLYQNEVDQAPIFPFTDLSLVYPTVPTPAYIRQALAATYCVNNSVQLSANPAANWWYHNPGCEMAFTASKGQIPMSSESTVARIPGNFGGCNEGQPDLDLSATGQTLVTPCTDVVLARLYSHQFVSWYNPAPANEPLIEGIQSLDLERHPNDSENVLKLLNWLVQLPDSGPGPEDEAGSSCTPSRWPTEREDRRRSDEVSLLEPITSQNAWCHGAVHPDDDILDDSQLDYGYLTAGYQDSEVELMGGDWSDVDWTDWEDHFECESAHDPEA